MKKATKRSDTRGCVCYRALFELQAQLVQETMRTMQIELGQVKIEMHFELGQVKIEMQIELGQVKIEMQIGLGQVKMEMQIELGLMKIMGYRVHPFAESGKMVSILLRSQFHRKNGR